ncbi:MAG: polysaccharide pyruvyl transferase family protein, partial [Synergistaceae bacterium]|nr:polysaccharide pyruvyl transferase family protein [Synergistaceae bacterium]
MTENKKHSSPLTSHASLLLGYYGFGNLGDELLLNSCVKILNSRGISNENIIALSNNPEETQKNFQIKSVNRWKISEIVKAMRKSENLILGGGGLFQDSTSVKSCVYYWGIVRLAKFFGLKISAIGQSIGPLNTRTAKFLTGNALKLFESVQVRDENS